MLNNNDFGKAQTRSELIEIAHNKGINLGPSLRRMDYELELEQLQTELVHLQNWVIERKMRVAILFEGRDAAGKGGSIKRFIEHLNPRAARVVALSKPTEVERGQWYFRRYIKELPNPGEIVLFDRSWYNRAVVEPVMGFCGKDEYHQFLRQVPEIEHILYEDGIHLIKFWFSITKEEQQRRFTSRRQNPLKRWKLSPVDLKGQALWDDYSFYRDQMFSKTHTPFSPWVLVQTDEKRAARLESIRYVLSQFDYPHVRASADLLIPNPNIVFRYYRKNGS